MPATTRLPLTGATLAQPLDFMRSGMPALDAVHQVTHFTPRAGGPTYQVIHTTEFDAYDPPSQTAAVAELVRQGPPTPSAIGEELRRRPPPGEDFAGTDRKAAKLSIGTGNVEEFADVAALIDTLPSEDAMINRVPPIPITAESGRVDDERRNVRVTGFLYAASHEDDNDFHLIVGRDVSAPRETYLTMEVSGLPPANSDAFQALNTARAAFKTFFGAQLPPASYDFYDPPIPVVVEGSLFFDMTHARGQAPGPSSLKSRMPVIWEVHPVTAITLG